MKKITSTALLLLFVWANSTALKAQENGNIPKAGQFMSEEMPTYMAPKVEQGTYPFVKKVAANAPGLTTVLDGSTESILTVIENKFKEAADVKVKSFKKDIYLAEAAKFQEISNGNMDYYFKISPVSKENQDQCQVTLFISAGNNNFITKDKYGEEMDAASQFLVNLDRNTRIFNLNAAIAVQQKLVEEAKAKKQELEKAKEDLDQEKADIEKQQEELANKLEENAANMEKNAEEQAQATEKVTKVTGGLTDLQKKLQVLQQ
ncbi:MAG: hypothetical protein AAGI38_10480 [Bacteroidota bacterium]